MHIQDIPVYNIHRKRQRAVQSGSGIRYVPDCIRCGIQVKIMKDQNAPLWHNGQTPTSENQSGSQNDAERQAQQQNQKSEKNKRSH